MVLHKVEQCHIEFVFPFVQHLLQKAVDTNLGETSLEDTKNNLLEGRQQLWICINELTEKIELALTTQIVYYPTQKHLQIHLTGAEPHTIDNWLHSWSKPLEDFCKENDIKFIECAGREGWIKVLGKLGYKKYVTVLVKEL